MAPPDAGGSNWHDAGSTYVVGTAYDKFTGVSHAAMWVSTPTSAPFEAARLEASLPGVAESLRAQTTFRFENARAGDTDIRIFDVQGRLMRTIVSESMTSGTHSTLWDGRNDAGRLVAGADRSRSVS